MQRCTPPPPPPPTDRAARWRALGLAALLLLLQAGGERLALALRLDASSLAAGQFWRLVTAHLVHLSWPHALLNTGGLLLCWVLAPRVFDRALPGRLGALALGVGLCLWWLSPQALPYVGLSGVLYGLWVLGLAPQLRARDPVAALALLLITGWMLGQWALGAAPAEERMLGGRVVSEAHLYGYGLALLGLAGAAIARRWRARREPPPAG